MKKMMAFLLSLVMLVGLLCAPAMAESPLPQPTQEDEEVFEDIFAD